MNSWRRIFLFFFFFFFSALPIQRANIPRTRLCVIAQARNVCHMHSAAASARVPQRGSAAHAEAQWCAAVRRGEARARMRVLLLSVLAQESAGGGAARAAQESAQLRAQNGGMTVEVIISAGRWQDKR